MTDGRPQRQVLLPALRRFWALALVAGLAAGFAATWAVQSTSSTTWSAEATYIVPLAAQPVTLPNGVTVVPDPLLPTGPTEAARFAQAYAVLLVEDPNLLAALGTATGEDPAAVGEQTSAVPVPDSSVLRIGYSSGTEEQVVAYFATLETALQAVPAVSSNIPAGNLRLLRGAEPSSQSGLRALAPIIGVLVGLAVGLGLAVLLERIDPRLRSSADVRELADWPVLKVAGVADDARTQVLTERVLAAAPSVRTVAVVGTVGTSDLRLQDITDQLQAAEALVVRGGAASQRSGQQVGGPVDRRDPVRWLAGSALGRDGAAERLVQQADVVVFVVPVHARLRHLTGAVQSIHDLVSDDTVFVALAPRDGQRGRARGPAAKDELDSWFEETDGQEVDRASGSTADGATGAGASAERVAGTR